MTTGDWSSKHVIRHPWPEDTLERGRFYNYIRQIVPWEYHEQMHRVTYTFDAVYIAFDCPQQAIEFKLKFL